MLTIRFKTVAMTAYLTLLIPVAIFFLTWLRLYIGIPATLILAAGFVWLWRKDYKAKRDTISVPIKHLVLIGICILAWVLFSGACGIFKSSIDIPWRTACLRDLITYDWPIVYPDTGYGLTYYVTFWLPVALIGKIVGMQGALALLWVYMSHFVFVAYLLILFLLRVEQPRKMWTVFIVFAFWSGLVFVGELVTIALGNTPSDGHLNDGQLFANVISEPYGLYFAFRSNYGIINNVYNQLAIWPALLLTLNNRRPRCFIFLGLVLMAFSPWGIIGIIPLMVALAFPWLIERIRERDALGIVKDILSPANISALVTCLPIFYLFLFKAGGEGVTSAAGGVELIDFSAFTPEVVGILILFFILQFVIYAVIIAPSYRRSPVFWMAIASLFVIPFIRIGSAGWDFCLNVSIPAFSTLMILCMGVLCKAALPEEIVLFAGREDAESRERRICVTDCLKNVRAFQIALAIAIFIGALSPLASMYGKAVSVVYTKSITAEWHDTTYTFADKTLEEESSLVAGAAEREGLFYQYIAR